MSKEAPGKQCMVAKIWMQLVAYLPVKGYVIFLVSLQALVLHPACTKRTHVHVCQPLPCHPFARIHILCWNTSSMRLFDLPIDMLDCIASVKFFPPTHLGASHTATCGLGGKGTYV